MNIRDIRRGPVSIFIFRIDRSDLTHHQCNQIFIAIRRPVQSFVRRHSVAIASFHTFRDERDTQERPRGFSRSSTCPIEKPQYFATNRNAAVSYRGFATANRKETIYFAVC